MNLLKKIFHLSAMTMFVRVIFSQRRNCKKTVKEALRIHFRHRILYRNRQITYWEKSENRKICFVHIFIKKHSIKSAIMVQECLTA